MNYEEICSIFDVKDTPRSRVKTGLLSAFPAEYQAYQAAKTRCTNPNHMSYDYYGGRGVEFRFTSFKEFLSELGPRPTAEHSVDRINTHGHYEIGNVRWATPEEQYANKKTKVTNQGYLRLVT